jgi:hypothetical protein
MMVMDVMERGKGRAWERSKWWHLKKMVGRRAQLRFVSRPSPFCYRQIDDMALAGSPRRTSFPPFVRGVELPSTLFTSHGTGRYAAIHLCPRSSCKDLSQAYRMGAWDTRNSGLWVRPLVTFAGCKVRRERRDPDG